MDDLIGRTVDRYQIVERIGAGGMASVYRAYQPALDRVVAIKILPPHFLHDETFVARFQREAKSAASLSHPHILPVYDYGRDGDLVFVVMQLITGGTLKEKIATPMDLRIAARIIGGVSAALDYAHSRGVIHRDVKPTNILLAEDDWPFLADFGIAKLAEGNTKLTKTGTGIGTPEYMSPEQAQGLHIDGRSDLYSLGSVLYEMVTGRTPFEGDNPLAIVFKHVYEPIRSVRELNPDLPESIDAIVTKILAKRADERYQTGAELSEALWDAVGQMTFTTPAPRTGPLTPYVPRTVDRIGVAGHPAEETDASLEPLYSEARLAISTGNWAIAAAKLKSISAINPTYRDIEELLSQATGQVSLMQSLETLYGLGVKDLQAGRYHAAADSLRRVVALDSSFKDAKARLAEAESRGAGLAAGGVIAAAPPTAEYEHGLAAGVYPAASAKSGGSGKVLIAAAVAGALLLGGGGAFAFSSMRSGPEPTPVLSVATAPAATATPASTATTQPTATAIPATATEAPAPAEPTAEAPITQPGQPTRPPLPTATRPAVIPPTTAPVQPTATPPPPPPTPIPTQPTGLGPGNLFIPTNTPAPTPPPSQGGDDGGGGGGTRR